LLDSVGGELFGGGGGGGGLRQPDGEVLTKGSRGVDYKEQGNLLVQLRRILVWLQLKKREKNKVDVGG